jgi:hypothetical protein
MTINDLTLLHYSKESQIKLCNNFYSKYKEYAEKTGDYFKPIGFWVSVQGEDDWLEYCKSCSFRMECCQFVHSVKLQPDSNILFLDTEQKIIDFSFKYCGENNHVFRLSDDPEHKYIHKIDWFRVMNEYDGMIIAPYQWSLRLHVNTSWYYSWDCASGCIWNLDCIKYLDLISTNQTAECPT